MGVKKRWETEKGIMNNDAVSFNSSAQVEATSAVSNSTEALPVDRSGSSFSIISEKRRFGDEVWKPVK